MPKLPGVSHPRAVLAFEKAGFRVVRQGKHIFMKRGDQTLVLPRGNPINAYTMAGIVRESGMTVAEFKKLL